MIARIRPPPGMIPSIALWISLSPCLWAAEPVSRPSPTSPSTTLEEARRELQNLDDLVDDADSRAVQDEIHRKVNRLDALLVELERAGLGSGTSTVAPLSTNTSTSTSTPTVSNTSPVGGPVPPSSALIAPKAADLLDALALAQNGVSATLPPTTRPLPPVTAPPRGPPATPGQMNDLLVSIDQKSFPTGKHEVIAEATRTLWFRCDQVIPLLQSFAFGSDQVAAAILLYPRVTDPENWENVYTVFTFESDKKALKAKIRP